MFGNILKKKILLEVSSRSPRTNLQMELSDVEMLLSMSLTEILADNIKSRIDDVLVCNGWLENQANQLGHECVTMNFESRHNEHFNVHWPSYQWTLNLMRKILLKEIYKW
ncbi:hypothetical protein AVEN_193438-1 [Araneus ventricosus]|uniref:Uncharacterized protein n=1 Tax=Araneus ventricosus TaxID=182803 RepID=A0A4Y2G4G5_ARAVE|nr:hypothetical protein AVEN_193438-1 [Araneus ventricosus]